MRLPPAGYGANTICNHYRNDPERLTAWAEYIGWNLPAVHEEMAADVWPVAKARKPEKRAGIALIANGARIIEPMHWGFTTRRKAKVQPKSGETKWVETPWTNARNLASNLWKPALANPAQRCLVPFSRFAEPKIGHGREEHWFSVNGETAAFAGIWREEEGGRHFAFLTCEPNPLVAPLHPKAMPVILHPEDYDRWLSCEYAEAAGMAVPFPSQLMRVES